MINGKWHLAGDQNPADVIFYFLLNYLAYINIYRDLSSQSFLKIKSVMEEFNLLSPLLLAVSGLMIGAILKSILQPRNIPYTVGLFAFGLLIGVLERFDCFATLPKISQTIQSVGDMNPDFILYVFLPILIFDAAYEMNMHIFKKTLSNATLLAGPGLIIGMLLTAALVMGFRWIAPEYASWSWSFALMFGALISATDPVAVVALLHELNTSKRFSTLVDGESLLNDGTGIVCFMLFFGAYVGGMQSGASPLTEFTIVVAGGALLGFILARAALWFITRINSEEVIQNSVIILAAYTTFILSQFYLGVSGVIALVAFGLTISYKGRPRLKPQVNEFMEKFWELLAHIANTLVFIIVGIVIAEKVDVTWTNIGILILLYIGLNLIRFVMIMMLYPLMKHLGYGLTKRESVILTWGGLRGALGMTLALMVSYTPEIPEEIRKQVLFFTAGIVTLTLSVNATTMRWLLKRLGLIHVSTARCQMEYRIQEHIYESSEKYFNKLTTREQLADANWDHVRNYLPEMPEEPVKDPRSKDFLAEIRLRVLDKEKSSCRMIYQEGIISKDSFVRLMASLDEMYDHDGEYALSFRQSIFNFCEQAALLHHLRSLGFMRDWISFYFRERIMIIYDLGRGFIILQREDLKFLDDLASSDLVSEEQKRLLAQLKEEITENINKMNEVIQKLAQEFPRAYHHALTQKSIRMLLSDERRTVNQLTYEGILSDKDAEKHMESINKRIDEVNSFSHTIPASLFRWMIHKKKQEKPKK